MVYRILIAPHLNHAESGEVKDEEPPNLFQWCEISDMLVASLSVLHQESMFDS